MARDSLTGTRIRERREIAGIKQADLARHIGISASYLNLIEHNRRRIGGKLLLDIAAALDVDAQALTEGTEAALIASLREAALAADLADDEVKRLEEFAGRFPGWSKVLVDTHRRVAALERTVETLSDRMAHDPHLAASLHEVLTTTAAIRSTAAILAETPDLEGPLRHRFHANMHQDSQRLSDSARTLVRFLDSDPLDTGATGTAQDDVEAWLAQNEYTFPQLENGDDKIPEILEQAALPSTIARHIATGALTRYAADAVKLPLKHLRESLDLERLDPAELAHRHGVRVPVILRRLAALPEIGLGLVVADRAGSLIFRKPTEGFAVPKIGAACPLWPLFDVFGQTGQLIRMHLRQDDRMFEVFATSDPQGWNGYNRPPLAQALMLIKPIGASNRKGLTAVDVGSACRVCARTDCAGRREPSILAAGK